MKVLVTGAEGQLAGEIIRQCMECGYEVIAHNRVTLDICDAHCLNNIVAEAKPDVVVNCAAYNDVDKAETDWQTAYMVNGIGVKNLAYACRKFGAVLMHFSSDYVFDGTSSRPYTIGDIPRPISRYAASKHLGEQLMQSHIDRFFLIRTSWVFGNGKFSFPLRLLEWAGKNRVLRIVDDQASSPTYAADLAQASIKLLNTENYGLFHITNSGSASKYEWAGYILNHIGWDGLLQRVKSEEFNSPAQRPKYSVLDNFPLDRVIGGTPPGWQDATDRFMKELKR